MTDTTTSFLAIWGAVLGTIGTIISVFLAVREFRKDRHRVRVSVDVSEKDPFWIIPGGAIKTYVIISVLNTGFRPIQVKNVLLVLSDGKTIDEGRLIKGKKFPQILEESQSVDVHFEFSEFQKALTEKKFFIKSVLVKNANGNDWQYTIPKKIRQLIFNHAKPNL